jgi:hypothetical protein
MKGAKPMAFKSKYDPYRIGATTLRGKSVAHQKLYQSQRLDSAIRAYDEGYGLRDLTQAQWADVFEVSVSAVYAERHRRKEWETEVLVPLNPAGDTVTISIPTEVPADMVTIVPLNPAAVPNDTVAIGIPTEVPTDMVTIVPAEVPTDPVNTPEAVLAEVEINTVLERYGPIFVWECLAKTL